jgi:hypothetical protein
VSACCFACCVSVGFTSLVPSQSLVARQGGRGGNGVISIVIIAISILIVCGGDM